jgi:hypothetical protein
MASAVRLATVLKTHRRSVSPATSRDFQFNPALYFSNDDLSRVMGYIVFTYTFICGATKRKPVDVRKDVGHILSTVTEKPKSPRSRISAGLVMFRRKNVESKFF